MTAISLVTLVLPGCAAFNTVQFDRHISSGQELLDLKKAKDAGIITEEQYQEQVQTILKRKDVTVP